MSTNTLGNYESMSIAASGNPCLEQATKKVFQERITNYLEDIDGSQHKNKYEKFYRDTIIMNSTGDDSIISRNKQTRRENVRDALFIDDIDGVRRRVKDKMIETKRCINPLEPDYKLPEIEIRVHTPPRFLRDSTRLDDIVGSSPVPLYRSKQRDPLKISDIPGTKYVPK